MPGPNKSSRTVGTVGPDKLADGAEGVAGVAVVATVVFANNETLVKASLKFVKGGNKRLSRGSSICSDCEVVKLAKTEFMNLWNDRIRLEQFLQARIKAKEVSWIAALNWLLRHGVCVNKAMVESRQADSYVSES